MVGERPVSSEAYAGRRSGTDGSENAGMSSEIPMRNRNTEYPRFPTQRSSSWGESGPNMSPVNRSSGWTIGLYSYTKEQSSFSRKRNKGSVSASLQILIPGD